jgi:trimeric autotransporter adhesin
MTIQTDIFEYAPLLPYQLGNNDQIVDYDSLNNAYLVQDGQLLWTDRPPSSGFVNLTYSYIPAGDVPAFFTDGQMVFPAFNNLPLLGIGTDPLPPIGQAIYDLLVYKSGADNFRVSFSDVINVKFETSPFTGLGLTQSGDLVYGSADGTTAAGQTQWLNHVLADGSVDPDGTIDKAGVILKAGLSVSTNQGEGQALIFTILHETSHALGLHHPYEIGLYSSYLNNYKYTVMVGSFDPASTRWYSEIQPPENNPLGHANFNYTLQLLDILALQDRWHSRNYDIRAGDTTYDAGHGFTTVDPDSGLNKPFLYTIWDGSGIDVIDASAYKVAAEIDLRQGHFSSIGDNINNDHVRFDAQAIDGVDPDPGNVAIAFYTVIENAIGTGLDDTIVGNAWDNVLFGANGSDTIYGDGLSKDFDKGFVSEDTYRPWNLTDNLAPDNHGSGNDVLTGGLGNDALYGGLGNDVLHGGFVRIDINNATTSWSTYWNDSAQFTGIEDIDYVDDGLDTANYSRLYLSDASGAQSLHAGDKGITVKMTGTSGIVQKGTLTGGVGKDGTDHLYSIEKVVGTAGDDVFSGTRFHGTSDPSWYINTNIIFDGGAGGNDKYIFTVGQNDGQGGQVIIRDASGGHGSLYIQDNPGDHVSEIFASVLDSSSYFDAGHNTLRLDILGNISGDIDYTIYLDATAIEDKTGIGTIEIDGVSIGAKDLVDYILTTDNAVISEFDGTSGRAALTLHDDIYGGGNNGSNGPATQLDPNGYITGMTPPPPPNSGPNGRFIPVAVGTEIEHPWIVTGMTMVPVGDKGLGIALTSEFYVKELDLDASLSPSDVRLVYNPSYDTLTAYVGGSLNTYFNIPNYVSGKEISGIAVWDTILDDAARSAGIDSLTPGSAGHYEINYHHDFGYFWNGVSSVDVTYWLETMAFGDGTVWNMQADGVTFTGTSSSDVLEGRNEQGDILQGLGSADDLWGYAGNDTFIGGTGNDASRGGVGNDTFIFSAGDGSDQVIENLGEGTDTIAFQGIDPADVRLWTTSAGVLMVKYTSTETLTVAGGHDASSAALPYVERITFDDTLHTVWDLTQGLHLINDSTSRSLYGTAYGDTFDGGGGTNNIYGYGGNDTLTGGPGNGAQYGGLGDDTYVISAGDGSDQVIENLSEGTDTIAFHGIDPADVLLWTTSGGSLMIKYTSTETLTVGGGNDGSGAVNVGAYVERITFDDAGSTVWDLTQGLHLVNDGNVSIVYGSSYGDTIEGGSGGQNLYGYAGNDTLDGGAGADWMVGGTGDDTYVVDNASDGVSEAGSQGTDTIQSSITFDLSSSGLFAYIENLTLTGSSSLNGGGNALDNIITSNTGVDTLTGGAGNDTYVVNNASDVIVEGSSAGTDLVQTGLTFSLASMSNVENLTLTGSSSINGTGNSLDNVITSNSGVDTLTGSTGNDTYVVNNASDVIVENSSEGTDLAQASVSYTLGSNVENLTLTGSANINGTGNGQDNIITGNSGNNTLEGGSGTDTLVGGTGNDTYTVDTTADVITENSSEGSDTVSSSVTFSLASISNVENLILTGSSSLDGTGNSLDNIITSNTGVDTLNGGTGNDTYVVNNASDVIVENSSEGTDTVQAGMSWTLGSNIENLALTGSSNINATGNSLDNVITSNSGVDTLTGGTGNDTYIVNNASDVIVESSSEGTDVIISSVNYTLSANVETLVLTGSSSLTITGNSLDNIITSNTAADTLTGSTGNDTYVVNNASDVIVENASEGTDLVQSSVTYTLAANAENLTLTGSSSINGTGNSLDNIITGNSGNNLLDGGAGIDTLIGGTGDDSYVVDTTTDVITENSSEGTDTVQSSVGYTLGSNLENLTLTGSSNINGTGNSLNNVLTSNSGVNTLTGGTGNDTYVVSNASDVIVENSSEGTDTVQSGVTFSLASIGDVENLTLTGSSNINGTGNSLDNIITGNSGNNTLDGGSGTDTLIGGTGNDSYVVDTTTDVITENASEGTDTIQSSVTYTLGSNLENLTLTGSSSINGIGNSLNNVLTSNSGVNTLTGGTGNDTYVVSNASDVVVESASEGTDTVQSSVSWTLGTNVENLTLTGSSNINATGNSAVNVVTGNSGNNSLDGGSGADTMSGGAGNDTYFVDNTGDVINENASEGTDAVQSSVTYTLSDNVESLTLTGSSSLAGAGNGQDNIITGNSGSNTLDGGGGVDTLIGGTGNDTYMVDNTGDVVTENASEGTDLVESAVTYTLGANVENLTLTGVTNTGYANIDGTGNSLNNVITGNSGDNTLDGGAGVDTLIGGAGDDSYIVDTTTDVITESNGGGADSVQSSVTYTLGSYLDNLTLTGSSNLNGTGNSLDNILTSNTGVDTLTGGAGNDTYVVNNASDVIVENSGEGTDTVQTGFTWTLATNFENLTLTGSSNINGTGNSVANVITSNSGVDTLTGGTGNDTYVVNNASDVIVENSSEGTDLVQSSVSFTLVSNTENLTLIGSSNIDGAGNSAVNIITGNGGDNTLDGGSGADTMIGGRGNDTYVVDDTSDVVTEGAIGGTDLVQSSVNWTLGAYVENLALTGSSGLTGTGNSLDNTLTSNTGVDTLIGGVGDDTYVTNNASDVVTENASEGTDLVQSSVSFTLGSYVENLTLTGSTGLTGTGNSLANIITSNSGVDTLTGGTGNDTYVVSNASDVIVENSSEGTDLVLSGVNFTLATNVEKLTLTGSDTLAGTGNSLDNTITGNSGNNTLDGGAGTDTLVGGAGNDTYVVDTTTDVITENASEGTDTIQSSITFNLGSYANIENLMLTGSSNINGTGNSLDNLITSNSGIDTLTGGTGNDTYVVSNASDVIVENSSEGTDVVQSSITFSISSMSNVENLTLTGSSNINGTGNSAANIITSNSGVDTLTGGAGNDTYVVSSASDVIVENSSEGTDLVQSSATFSLSSMSNVESLTLTGSSNIDGTGNSGVNVITGNTGDNSLDGGSGADTMIGGAGNDIFVVDDASDVVTENASEGTDTVQSGITWTLGTSLENLTLTGSSNINGAGNSLDNVLTSNSGVDTLTGGAGNDTFVVSNASDVIVENSSEGTDLTQSSVSFTLASNVENLTLTGSSGLSGTGNSAVNVITGNSGDNSLDGGSGADTMIGGGGNDTYIVDNTGDVVTEGSSAGTDAVQSSVSYTLSSNIENLTLTGSSNINGSGNSLDNVITSNTGVDTLTGGAGNDTYAVSNASDVVVENSSEGTDLVQSSVTFTLGSDVENLTLTGSSNIDGTGNSQNNVLTSNSGVDTLTGGAGDDTYVVNNASDVVVETGSNGTDLVQASVTFSLGSNVENLTLTGSSNINATGNSQANAITGNSGDNTLTGGADDDTYLFSDGKGHDVVIESSGTDTIQFDATVTVASVIYSHSGNDLIIGYGTGTDTITVKDFFSGSSNQIEQVLFSDSTTHDVTYISAHANFFTGTSGDDVLSGTSSDDVMSGLGGNDTLSSFAGNDTLDGGTGNDTLNGGTGLDTMTGGTGDDVFVVDNSSDVVTENASEGTDTVQSSITYTLGSNLENLTLTGSSNINGTGNSLDNVITSNSGADTLTGGAGSDTYVVNNSSDVIVENSSEGTDLAQSSVTYNLGSNVENLTLTGSSTINGTGNSQDNIITGNSGNNTLDGGSGTDNLTGGAGNDTYVVDTTADVITENTSEGTDTIQSSVTFSLGSISNVENLTLTGSSNINGTGNNLDNVITSNSGVNTLTGGTGNDTYAISNASDVIVENSSEGTDVAQSSVSYTIGSNVENLTLTGSSNLNGTGNSGVNVITGNSGNNTLDGGSGADTLVGGAGNDAYLIDNGGDVITENASEGTDTAQSSVTYTIGSNVENLTLTGSSSLNGTGNGQDNILTSNSGVDTLTGGDGNDTYVMNNASDVIVENASEGTDLVQAGMTFSLSSFSNVENLTLTGSSNYNGTGNSGVNVITGNSGNNTLDGGSGADTLIGGAGDDLYLVDNTSDVLTENASEGTDTVQSSVSYTLSNYFENLTLTGSSSLNGTGNGQDNIITSNTGVDTLTGGAGNDTYVIGNGSDVIVENASEGTDLVQSSITFSISFMNYVENLTLTGSSNINGTGNTLDNIITGNSGTNTVTGGAGNDTYIVSTGDVVVENSSEGTDLVQSDVTWTLGNNTENLTLTGSSAINGTGNTLDNVITGNSGVNTLTGSDGADTLYGMGGNDSLTGGNGNDTLDGGTGNDTMTGGANDDLYIVDSTSDVATESSSSGTDTVQSSVTWTLGTNFENLTLTGSSNIDGTGNTAVNIITGNSGNNTLDGGTGADSMIGGAGDDYYLVDDASDVVTESASSGTDEVHATPTTYTLSSDVENLSFTGGGGSKTGTGNSLSNVITGGTTAADSLSGLGGDDTLDGIAGIDTYIGGTGNDVYYMYDHNTVIVENSTEGTDTILYVSQQNSYTMAANVENLTLLNTAGTDITCNSENNVITANSGSSTILGADGNDTLYGMGGNDSLSGGNGNDTLDGGTGNDTMTGGANDDLYIVDSTSDVATESASSGTDAVQSSVTWTLGTNFENLTLTGSSAVNGTGNTGDNIIIGNSGANTLSASSGTDTLDGGDGLDSLTGSTGADTFVFHLGTAFNNIDVVTDFNKTTDNDKLDIHDMLSGYDAAHDVITNWVRISDSGGNSTVEVDRDGAGGTYGWTQIATLTGITGLTDEAALVSSGNLIVA